MFSLASPLNSLSTASFRKIIFKKRSICKWSICKWSQPSISGRGVDCIVLDWCIYIDSWISPGMGSMPNLSTVVPLAPMSNLTSVPSISPMVISTPLLPSASPPSLPNGTSSLLQPLAMSYSSSEYPNARKFPVLTAWWWWFVLRACCLVSECLVSECW